MAAGCSGLISFGVAGGLAPSLKPGACVIGSSIIEEGDEHMIDARWALAFGTAVIGVACIMATDLTSQWATADFLPSQILQAIGVGYEGMDKPDEALRNIQQSMDINRKLGKKGGVANSLVEIAHIQNSLGKPDAALASFEQALSLEKEIGAKKDAADLQRATDALISDIETLPDQSPGSMSAWTAKTRNDKATFASVTGYRAVSPGEHTVRVAGGTDHAARRLRLSADTIHTLVVLDASKGLRGDSLEDVLNRHLLTVEKMSDIEIMTSILLLSPDGKRLTHGAAPSLPGPYVEAIDGSEIGPVAGSCGTAAYLGRPVYVTDIATDPLWAAYRDLALPHGRKDSAASGSSTGLVET